MSKKLLAVTLVLCVTGVLVMVGTANAQPVREVKIVLNPGGRVMAIEIIRATGATYEYPGEWEDGLPTDDEVGRNPKIIHILVFKKPGDPCVYVNGKRRCW